MPFEFGSVDERLKERITIRLDKQIYDKLCSENRVISAVVRDAIIEYINAKKEDDVAQQHNKKSVMDVQKW